MVSIVIDKLNLPPPAFVIVFGLSQTPYLPGPGIPALAKTAKSITSFVTLKLNLQAPVLERVIGSSTIP